MRRILFQWGALTVWSYPAMLYIGLVAGVVAGNAAANAAGIDAFRVFMATYILIVPALIGARLLEVAGHWQIYRRDPRRIWNRVEGGAAQYGGFALTLPLSVPLLAVFQLPLGAFWDVGMLTILVGMIFTRIGCLMNGCCAGRPSRAWVSMYLPNHLGVWEQRLPTQYLEAGWAAVLLVTMLSVWRWLPFAGALFLLATAGYATGRLALESMRERQPGASPFTIHHAISAVMIGLSLAALMAAWPR